MPVSHFYNRLTFRQHNVLQYLSPINQYVILYKKYATQTLIRINWFTAFFKSVAVVYRHKKYPWVCGVEMQI